MAALPAIALVVANLSAFTAPRPVLAADLVVYADSLTSDWGDWSWTPIDRNLANTAPVHSGSASIAVTCTGGWSGLQFGRNTALGIPGYNALRVLRRREPDGQ